MKNNIFLTSLIFPLILLAFVSCSENQHNDEIEQPATHIIVPLYSFPTDDNGNIWASVYSASQEVPIDVIWGMVDTLDAPIYRVYTDWLKKSKYIGLYAYVATTSGEREMQDVKNEIDFYANNFNIDGIFFDEVTSDSQYIPYYRNIVSYAKQNPKIKKAILNSSYAPVDFLEKTDGDVLIIFENYGSDWDNFTVQDYNPMLPEEKAVIVSNVNSSTRMEEIINEAVENNIGHIFVTDRGYDFLPSYWNDEVNLIKEINRNSRNRALRISDDLIIN